MALEHRLGTAHPRVGKAWLQLSRAYQAAGGTAYALKAEQALLRWGRPPSPRPFPRPLRQLVRGEACLWRPCCAFVSWRGGFGRQKTQHGWEDDAAASPGLHAPGEPALLLHLAGACSVAWLWVLCGRGGLKVDGACRPTCVQLQGSASGLLFRLPQV